MKWLNNKLFGGGGRKEGGGCERGHFQNKIIDYCIIDYCIIVLLYYIVFKINLI